MIVSRHLIIVFHPLVSATRQLTSAIHHSILACARITRPEAVSRLSSLFALSQYFQKNHRPCLVPIFFGLVSSPLPWLEFPHPLYHCLASSAFLVLAFASPPLFSLALPFPLHQRRLCLNTATLAFPLTIFPRLTLTFPYPSLLLESPRYR